MAIPLESLLGRFGTSIGQGLTGGLHQLAENKMQSVARQRQENAIKSLPPELQGIWNLIPQKNQGEILSGLAQGGFFDQQQDQKQMERPQRSEIEKSLGEQQPQNKQVPSALDLLNMLNGSRAGGLNRAAQQSQTQEKSLTPQQQLAIGSETEQKSNEPRKLSVSGALSKAITAKQEAKERLQAKKLAHEEKLEAHKEKKKLFEELYNANRAAEDSQMRLDRMSVLNDRGKIPDSLINSALKAFSLGGYGIDLTSLAGADAEEFDKISSDFLKDAKKIFGSRLTDTDVRMFLKTVPTLTQSPEGRRRLIHNLSLLNKASKARYEAATNIIKENGGYRPIDFEIQLDERSRGLIDNISKEFTQSIDTYRPEEHTTRENLIKRQEHVAKKSRSERYGHLGKTNVLI
jgi:hypothetical protein